MGTDDFLRDPCRRIHDAASGRAAAVAGHLRRLGAPGRRDYIRSIGITSIELLPIHAFLDDRHLLERGLRNFWGYNCIGFFAPEPRYSATGTIGEFKEMVARFHDAGIEVILDVVYNHTAEGNERGPTLSFKGIDNARTIVWRPIRATISTIRGRVTR